MKACSSAACKFHFIDFLLWRLMMSVLPKDFLLQYSAIFFKSSFA